MEKIENYRKELEDIFNQLCEDVGKIAIASQRQLPHGWRKSAKGRTVWRIVEEIISQNLEKNRERYQIDSFNPADSEVGVYDFVCKLSEIPVRFYINIKAAVSGTKKAKDDISKAYKLSDFIKGMDNNSELFIATFTIVFNNDLTIHLQECIVMPITWVPDIYVNPSNNGNLQSSKCKFPETWIKRSKEEFIRLLDEEILVAKNKLSKSSL